MWKDKQVLNSEWVKERMGEIDYCEEDSWDVRSKWEKSRASGGFSEGLYAWEVLLFDPVDILQKRKRWRANHHRKKQGLSLSLFVALHVKIFSVNKSNVRV